MGKKLFKTAAAAILFSAVVGSATGMTVPMNIYAQETETTDTTETLLTTTVQKEEKTEEKTETNQNTTQLPELSERDLERARFRMILCVIFGVGISVAIAIWGNPNERLKSRYKRARKLQKKQEKERLAKERAEQKKQEVQAAEKQKEE